MIDGRSKALFFGVLDLRKLTFIVSCVSFFQHIKNRIAIMAATDQIRQMVNFILQEAHEKANEIRVKVGCCTKHFSRRGVCVGAMRENVPSVCEERSTWCIFCRTIIRAFLHDDVYSSFWKKK